MSPRDSVPAAADNLLWVDGRSTAPQGTVMDACRAVGADVAALCSNDRLPGGGHCRACMVEVDGQVVASCTTQARAGMVVHTDTPALRTYRRDLGELMVSESTPRGQVSGWLARWGVTGGRYPQARAHAGRPAVDQSHAYLRLDVEACIRCQLCVRACADIQGQFVLAMQGRGDRTVVGLGPTPFKQTDCVSCGACAAVCPSGALTDVDRQRAEALGAPVTVTRTTCAYCGVGCQLEVHTAEGQVVRVEGADAPVNRGHLCVKGRYAHRFVRHPDRLTTPLIRSGDGTLQPATWDEALETVARGFARLRGSVAALSSSRCTNEENYLVQKWFRAAWGTHNVDSCARVCHAPSAAGMRHALGTGAATNSLVDLERADLILVAGSNTTEAHPVTGARIRQAALRGTTLLVVDPRRTELAALADVHLQVRPGTNVPLFNALAHVLVEEDLVNHAFVRGRVEGWEAFCTFIRAFSPESTAATTGVPAAQVREAARLYGRAARPMQVHGLGITEHHQGSESVMLLCNLALLVGALGREGVGVNPLRGQNNVQGAADMGCQPDLLTGYQDPARPDVRERFERVWGRALPAGPGLTLPAMYDAARAGRLRGMFILGEDVVHSDPDVTRVKEALGALEFLVVQEIFPSQTTALAHVVLPGAAFLEKDGTFTNGERRIQRVRRALDPPGQARPDWRILLDLMAASGLPQAFGGPADILDEVARVSPAWAGVSHARLDGDGLQWPVPHATHPGTPILHTDTFPRGRGLLSCVPFVPSPSLAATRAAPLALTTGRVLQHYNTGSMTRRTDNVRLVDRDLLEIHPLDAAERRIVDGDRVRVWSRFGEAVATARVTDRVRRGALFLSFHFPQTGTNLVTGDVVDRLAGCPEYKLTAVDVAPLQTTT